MKKKKHEVYNDPWDRDFYETGSTQPPKDRGGLIALLLVAVILLGSLCSALGIINLHLLRQLAREPQQPDSMNVFESTQDGSVPSPIGENSDSHPIPRMGVEGQTVSDFDRQFYQLPQGFLITQVQAESRAEAAGIHAGDVIFQMNGQSVLSLEELEAVLESCPADTAIQVEFYRHQTGKILHTQITLTEE